MQQVLITISGGIIDQVVFYNDASKAVQVLSEYVKSMNLENNDAAVYGPDGMIANAKLFLDDNDRYVDNSKEILKKLDKRNRPIYIIGNPYHRLGFMVASHDDPLGYKDPVAALSDLGQMRQDHGIHLKLYQVITVQGSVASREDLEHHNEDCEIEDFDYSLVEEYLQ